MGGILSSTNSGKEASMPKLRDFGLAGWTLHVPEQQFWYGNDRHYIIEVEFEFPYVNQFIPPIKDATFRVWDGWDEYKMHITSQKELDLATEWMVHYTTSYTTRGSILKVTNKKIIEVARQQRDEYNRKKAGK